MGSGMSSKIAVVIPAYNEEKTIASTMEGFARELPEAFFVIVDNNSSDDTARNAKSSLRNLNLMGVILSERRQGKGYAVRRAFHDVDAGVYVMVDADTTYNPKDVHRLLLPVLSGEADMVVGDRRSDGIYDKQNNRMFHSFGNNLITKLINFFFNSDLSDILSGYRVFSRRFVKNFPILCAGFEIETELTLHALDKRFRVEEIPVKYSERPTGSVSKLKTYSDGIRILRTIMWVFKDYKPLFFFGIFSLCFFLLGFAIGVPVIMEFVRFRYVYRVPSAILSTGLMIFSLLFFAIGFILDTVAKFHKFNYELQLLGYREDSTDEVDTCNIESLLE